MAVPTFVEPSLMSRTLNWVKEIIEATLNWIFSLNHSAGQYRNTLRWMILVLLYMYFVLTQHSLDGWIIVFQNLNVGMLNPNTAGNSLMNFLGSSFLHPVVLRHMLALIAPYMVVHILAAAYLADIFEKEVSVADRFLNEAAFATDYQIIRIRAGKLVDTDYDCPIVQIGGPGFITVELDSAAVFEGPDGNMRVIGPTANLHRGRAVIHDFERLRQCVDLRDIIGQQEVTSRSRDGIIVKARDVQYSYSVYRGENPKKNLETPYPYDLEAIKTMVKEVVMPVTPGKPPQKTPEWTRPLPGGLFVSVNIEFGNFISKRGLSEFFSSIGAPEEESLRQNAEKITQDAQSLAGQNGYNQKESPLKAGPFTARPSLAENLFGSPEFKTFTKKKGLQVNWIGVGIWETPNQIIPENHKEAWKQSIKNAQRGGEEQLTMLYNNSRNSTLMQYINKLPITAYYRLNSEQKTDQQIIDGLFEQYFSELRSISKSYEDQGKKIPENIATALQSVDLLQNRYHDISNEYYLCTKSIAKPDINIQGAENYTIEVAVSTRPLPGYKVYPVHFDFRESQELEFVIAASIENNTTLYPNTPQKQIMRNDDLYIRSNFQATILPNAQKEIQIELIQDKYILAKFVIDL